MSQERKATETPALATSGFFVLRTPLLPLGEWLSWGEGLRSPQASADGNLEQALESDRQTLRERLRQIVARPEVREALFVASPSLDESLDAWMRQPSSERGQKVERTLVRYFTRMCSRPTPFGLFAGCSVGTVADRTRLQIDPRTAYERHTRLDMDFLTALTQALGREAAAREAFAFFPNSSLYQAAGRLRYVESRLEGKARTYHLAAVEPTDYLLATLQRSAAGARLSELERGLCEADAEVSAEEAKEYVATLLDNQILVPDFGLPVTGPEPAHRLIAQLRDVPSMAAAARRLRAVQDGIGQLDAQGLGRPPEHYRELARGLEGLPAKVELPRLFQVDLHKPAAGASLGPEVVDEIVEAVRLLHRIAPKRTSAALERFKEAFRKRYEGREVRLVDALDEEAGIGFEASTAPAAEGSPLLEGLAFPAATEESASWSARDAFLLTKLSDTLRAGSKEISLSDGDLRALENKEPPPLPDAFMVLAKLIGAPLVPPRRILVGGIDGPSGAKLLGRFCHGDPKLSCFVEQHLRAEEALRPEAIYAEIVHLPEGRIGNVLLRPVLREYEIPYLGLSGAPREKQIPVTDLTVSLLGPRIVLRSMRLGKEVVPRMTNAHNFGVRSLGIYRFLCSLQIDGVAPGLGFGWGTLENAPYLPRVVRGRLVLSKARWRLRAEEIKGLTEKRASEPYRAVQQMRHRLGLPRWVQLAEGDNALLIDLDNALSVDTFVHLLKGRSSARLDELLPEPTELPAWGPEGAFAHELVIPFVLQRRTQSDRVRPRAVTAPFVRTVHPGSVWLYAKLYAGTSGVDQILRSVAPLIRRTTGAGAVDQWFFIRYGDPDWHLRLRLHGTPEKLAEEILPALQSTLAPLIGTGELWRLQLDTYEREIERYGGPEGILIAEKLFSADSDAALGIIELLWGDEGADARWRLALRGMDMLLDDLGLDLEAKLSLVKAARESFGREFRVDAGFEHQLGHKYRKERAAVEALLDREGDGDSTLAPGLRLLDQRSRRIRAIASELRACEAAGRLTATVPELAQSFLHMHANRLLRSAARAQELVLYDFLARTYESRLARARRGADARGTPSSTRTRDD